MGMVRGGIARLQGFLARIDFSSHFRRMMDGVRQKGRFTHEKETNMASKEDSTAYAMLRYAAPLTVISLSHVVESSRGECSPIPE
jgi:hypothetical protein